MKKWILILVTVSVGAWARGAEGEAIKISFRPFGNPVPEPGFIADNGKKFGQQEALTFGWTEDSPDRRLHFKNTNDNRILASGVHFIIGSKWQIALPNGFYEVAVCAGSADDNLSEGGGVPLLVNGVAYFGSMKPDRNIFIKQYRTVEVKDGTLTVETDASRLPKDWASRGRFIMVPFLEIKAVASASAAERTVVWSVDSNADTDREFYGLVPDIRSTKRPAAHPLDTLWYTKPAKIWDEGVPLGNGRLGAVVYGNPARERIQMNEDTLWNGSPSLPMANPEGKKYIDEAREIIFKQPLTNSRSEAVKFSKEKLWPFIFDKVFIREDGKFVTRRKDGSAEPPFMFDYLNGGDLLLDFADGQFHDYYRSLDMADGIATTHYVLDGVEYTREVFTSAVSGVLVARITADKPGSVSFSARGRDQHYGSKFSSEGNDTLLVDGAAPAKRGVPGAIQWQRRIKVIPEGGAVSAADNTLTVSGADAVTLLASIRTNFVNYKDVSADPVARTKQDIADAEKKTYAQLRAEHVADHHRLYDRQNIDLGKATTLELPTDERIRRFRESNDPQMVTLVLKFGRYLMMACSRPGTQAANLQGIWSAGPTGAWGGKYTVNINIQMHYWLPEPGNLSECHLPLMDMIDGLADAAQLTAKNFYNARGWVCHHNTDIWRYSHPIDGTAGMWPMASAWFGDHIWEHYLFTQDKEFLKKSYPALRDAAVFYLDYLTPDPRTGHLVSAPSMSPEMEPVTAAPTMDVQLVTSVFTKAAAAA
ncbi:MAG: glycoside hydrolase family 95 protein, partial [Verrucomicrobiales bacterium]|nr:glycoside hydrolase family 95 protein [Verrucomicrobiales bacterium]